MLETLPDAIVDSVFHEWGSPPSILTPELREVYVQALSDPDHARAICEEYRAAAGIDRQHDAADQSEGKTISCPVLALWSAEGPLDVWYAEQSGPLALWKTWASDVQGQSLKAGHFFPEELPEQTAAELRRFFNSGGSARQSR